MKKQANICDSKLLLSTKEAAQMLGLKPQTLRRWAIYENGPITPIRYGRLVRWSKREILDFARENV
ncbi:helix-turn-helix domain-containing protein [Acinetobacter ursingii]|nr:helix-turn-helix domain-containing protein [Acinetobacter ursingii]MCH2003906.1 helix-turn-helix domain-containing protein [Acinetobacter ursingii]MCU4304784.1 helix-turn-helix domain-containing protein [Acinetobacter ursingii]MCU4370789.1 helix-turn-helix domain-containing protein [Acinetobacter ursingii]MCU4380634.1 helix-turn-helix domain-containing protein [Acinetobacter ursingii]MCU4608344.1 helix-turn-helix domain-containing protein [Acinetobacter ursingii]